MRSLQKRSGRWKSHRGQEEEINKWGRRKASWWKALNTGQHDRLITIHALLSITGLTGQVKFDEVSTTFFMDGLTTLRVWAKCIVRGGIFARLQSSVSQTEIIETMMS